MARNTLEMFDVHMMTDALIPVILCIVAALLVAVQNVVDLSARELIL